MSGQNPAQNEPSDTTSSKNTVDELVAAAKEVPMAIKAKLDPVEKKANEDEDMAIIRTELINDRLKGLSEKDKEMALEATDGLPLKKALKIIAAIKSAAAKPPEKVEKPAAIGAPPVPSTQGIKPPGYYDPGFKWTPLPDPRKK